jgi:hypothetical protein
LLAARWAALWVALLAAGWAALWIALLAAGWAALWIALLAARWAALRRVAPGWIPPGRPGWPLRDATPRVGVLRSPGTGRTRRPGRVPRWGWALPIGALLGSLIRPLRRRPLRRALVRTLLIRPLLVRSRASLLRGPIPIRWLSHLSMLPRVARLCLLARPRRLILARRLGRCALWRLARAGRWRPAGLVDAALALVRRAALPLPLPTAPAAGLRRHVRGLLLRVVGRRARTVSRRPRPSRRAGPRGVGWPSPVVGAVLVHARVTSP